MSLNKKLSFSTKLMQDAEEYVDNMMKKIKGINSEGESVASMFHFDRVEENGIFNLELTIVDRNNNFEVYKLKRLGTYIPEKLIFNWITFYTNIYFWDLDYCRFINTVGRNEKMNELCQSLKIKKEDLKKILEVAVYVSGSKGFIQDNTNNYYLII